MHRLLGLAATLSLLAVAPVAVAQDVPRHPLGGARGVHIAYGEDPSTSMTIMWTGPPDPGARVLYGTSALVNEAPATAEPLPGSPLVAYSVTLEGLDPDTSYVYAAEADGLQSESYRFRTAPTPGEDTRFTFAAWSDHGVRDPYSPLGAVQAPSPTRNADLAREIDPDFHVAAGDIAGADGFTPTWERYFETHQRHLGQTPYMTVPGDHEREPGQGYAQYDARLEMPDRDRDRWYAFRYANALVVGLNTGEMCLEEEAVQAAPGNEWDCGRGMDADDAPDSQFRTRYPNPQQLNFLEGQLQRASHDPSVDWTIVVHHYPAYSSGPHGSHPDVQRFWVPVYDDHGVDLVINGHDRAYQRSEPVRYGETAEVGTTYVVNGAGGLPLDDLQGSSPAWEASRVGDTWGTAAFTVDGDRLEGRFLDLDGDVRDSFVLEDADDGARLVDPSAEEPADDAGAENGSAEEPPEQNRRDNGTAGDPGVGSGDSSGEPQGNASGLDEAGGAEAEAIPAPGLAAVLAALLLAARRRR